MFASRVTIFQSIFEYMQQKAGIFSTKKYWNDKGLVENSMKKILLSTFKYMQQT